MLKKFIIKATFCAALLAAAPAAATPPSADHTHTSELAQCPHNHECDQCPEATCVEASNIAATAENAPSEVQESKLAKQMTKEEKSKNAAENDSMGIAVTIVAMAIVLIALIILSLLFLLFGKVSSSVLTSKKRAAHGIAEDSKNPEHNEPDSAEAIAAISLALAEHFGQGHDIEDTILTIKSMKKAYSPWNSKIYNIRETPAVQPDRSSMRRPLK